MNLLGSHKNFMNIVKSAKISTFTNSYLVDLRNHGMSEHKDSMTLDDMSLDLANFIQKNNINSTYLMGHSLGGRVIMAFL